MEKSKKKYYAKRSAIYSIQFWRDKDGTLNCSETANDGSINESLNMYSFGKFIARSKLLDDDDKRAFRSFCQAFENEYWR